MESLNHVAALEVIVSWTLTASLFLMVIQYNTLHSETHKRDSFRNHIDYSILDTPSYARAKLTGIAPEHFRQNSRDNIFNKVLYFGITARATFVKFSFYVEWLLVRRSRSPISLYFFEKLN